MVLFADLHVHTTNSDGALTLDAIPEAARREGLSAVAITDHDRLHPALDAPVSERDGVSIIHGIELRVDPGGQRVDLLGYGVRPTPALTAELDRLQADRIERGRAIVDCLEDRLDVTLDVSLQAGVGRPHIARAVAAHDDTDYETVATVFHDLIGGDSPCYVPRDVTAFETGLDLLREACDFVALAHPLRYDDPEAALSLTPHLDAVERYYPYMREVDIAPVDRAIEEHDLLPTGGSDAHGDELGNAGLTRAQYDRVREHLSDSPRPQG